MASNSNYNPEKKTTKRVRGIHSLIKFQKHQGVESLTIQGKDTLADVSQDKNGDTILILMADSDKVNAVASNVPYLGVSHTITGEDPDKNKTANISQDLTQFPLSGGELVTVTKETDGLTIHDEKITEFVNTTLSAKETELKEYINEYSNVIGLPIVLITNGSIDGFGTVSPDIETVAEHNALDMIEIVLYDNKTNLSDLIILPVSELLSNTRKIYNLSICSLLVERNTDDKVNFTFNKHSEEDKVSYFIKWFTSYNGKNYLSLNLSYNTAHFEGYENPNKELTYAPVTPAETPSAPSTGEFPRANTEPTPPIETEGNVPQPIADEESH